MDEIKVIFDGLPTGTLEEVGLKEADVEVPLERFCASVGADLDVSEGKTVVCSGDLCVPVEVTRTHEGRSFTWLSGLSQALGLTWVFQEEDRELRLTTEVERTTGVSLRVGDLAPEFTLPDLSGRLCSSSSFRGKKAVFYVWASW